MLYCKLVWFCFFRFYQWMSELFPDTGVIDCPSASEATLKNMGKFLIWAWINGRVNNGEAGDLRRHRAHYDVNVGA